MQGLPLIDTGDYDRAKELLSADDYELVNARWTQALIDARKAVMAGIDNQMSNR